MSGRFRTPPGFETSAREIGAYHVRLSPQPATRRLRETRPGHFHQGCHAYAESRIGHPVTPASVGRRSSLRMLLTRLGATPCRFAKLLPHVEAHCAVLLVGTGGRLTEEAGRCVWVPLQRGRVLARPTMRVARSWVAPAEYGATAGLASNRAKPRRWFGRGCVPYAAKRPPADVGGLQDALR